MKNAFIFVGLSASGKSSSARNLTKHHEDYSIPVAEINRDNIRFRDIDPAGGWDTYKFTNENEKVVTSIWKAELELAILRGQNLILSDTNLKVERTRDIVNRCIKNGYSVSIHVLNIPVETCIQRDIERGMARKGGTVGEAIIRQQAEKLKEFLDMWNQTKYPLTIYSN